MIGCAGVAARDFNLLLLLLPLLLLGFSGGLKPPFFWSAISNRRSLMIGSQIKSGK
jgi:asparagine N-glycosylation enzyme membrane subunit Stt3